MTRRACSADRDEVVVIQQHVDQRRRGAGFGSGRVAIRRGLGPERLRQPRQARLAFGLLRRGSETGRGCVRRPRPRTPAVTRASRRSHGRSPRRSGPRGSGPSRCWSWPAPAGGRSSRCGGSSPRRSGRRRWSGAGCARRAPRGNRATGASRPRRSRPAGPGPPIVGSSRPARNSRLSRMTSPSIRRAFIRQA